MRRRTKNKLLLGALLCTGVAMYFLYDVLSGPGDYMVNLMELYDPPIIRDRWAAIKGEAVVQTLDDEVSNENDNEDAEFQMEAPPESQAFAEQKAVQELIRQSPNDDEDKEKSAGDHNKRRKRRGRRSRHQHPKVDEDDKTTVAVTVSTTETASTTEISVTSREKDGHAHVRSHERAEAREHVPEHGQEHSRAEEHTHGHAAQEHHDKDHLEHSVNDEEEERVSEEEHALEHTQQVAPDQHAQQHVQHQASPEQHAPQHVQHQASPEQHAPQHVQHQDSPEQHAQQHAHRQVAPEHHTPEHVQHPAAAEQRLQQHAQQHGHPHEVEKEHTAHGAKPHEHEHRPVHRGSEPTHHRAPGEKAAGEGTSMMGMTEGQVAWTPEQILSQGNDTGNATGAELKVPDLPAGRTLDAYNQTNITGIYQLSAMARGEVKPTNQTLQIQMMQQLPETPKKKSDRVNWEKFFSFIPNGLQSCTELFPNLDSQNPLPQDFQQAYIEFENILRHFQIKDNNIAEHLEQFIVYYFLVRAPFVKTVCETGFGAGHSAFLWLQANPDVKVYMFDLGIHEYSGPIADYLSAKFPGRLQVIWGDSVNTLPMFRQAHKDVTCDIVVIDGGHTFRESFADYFHLRQMVTINNIVLLDNYPDISKNYMEILGAVWEGGKRRGEINEIFHCDYRPHPHGFSVGRFIPYSLTLPESKR